MIYPKILVISNNCFSKSDSNGRTLGNFFRNWDKNKLAQFFINKSIPNYEVCEKYFCITDAQALKAVFGKRPNGTVENFKEYTTISSNPIPIKKHKRNALTMMIRNFVWNTNAWKRSGFDKWVEDFAPEAILLQAGDSAFMFRLARKIASKYGIPLFIYNSEGYYFKNFDYFKSKGIYHLLYPLFYRNFRREFKKTQKSASYTFYICDELKNAYDKEFGNKSTALYTSTFIKPFATSPHNNGFVTSYLGNLGVGRHEGLIEIANTLQKISPDYFLDIYGKIPNDTVKSAFDNCAGIKYHGVVSYDEVIKVMENSDLLVHTESFSEFYKEDLKFAFSTKIADSLASGRCFLLYSPDNIASFKYLNLNKLAYTVSSKKELEKTLRSIINNSENKQKYISNALKAVDEKHNLKKNSKIFSDIIVETVGFQN